MSDGNQARPMTPERVAAMQRLLDAATEGPWEAKQYTDSKPLVVPFFTRKGSGVPRREARRDRPVISLGDDGSCGDPECCGYPSYHVDIAQADLDFIAESRTFVPDLLEAYAAAMAELEQRRSDEQCRKQSLPAPPVQEER